MHSHNDHIVFDSLDDGTLHIAPVADMSQLTEDERMVGHDEITPLLNGLVDHRLSHV